MQVKIMRGLPGSGKTTFVNAFWKRPQDTICSADAFHVGSDGVYRYDPRKAVEAHAACLRKFVETLQGHRAHDDFKLIVDNTNTSVAELAPYVALALAYDVRHDILYFPCRIATAIKRNVHGVPHGTIVEMQRRLTTESLPVYYNVTVTVSDH